MISLSKFMHEATGEQIDCLFFPDLSEALHKEEPVIEQEKEEKPAIQDPDVMRIHIQKAQQILFRAREEAIKIKEDAYEKGYLAGMEKGCEEGRQKAYQAHKEEMEKELQKLRSETAEYITDMQHAKDRVLEKYLDDLKDIALAIAEKIVQTSLKSSGSVVRNMILAATSKLKKTAWAKIYIAQDNEDEGTDIQGDLEFLEELSKIADNVKVIVMEDEAPGTCIIELPQEVMDISVGTQMENIKEILNNARV